MRLINLEPRWAGIHNAVKWAGIDNAWPVCEHGRFRLGVTFRCPCKPDCQVRLGVFFVPLLDPDGVAAGMQWPFPGLKTWTRVSGEDFDTLSLTPSIDCSGSGHWHGFITNGAIT